MRFSNLPKHRSFSRPQLIVFVLAFGIIGYLLIRAFAAGPLVASLEAEQMTLVPGSGVVTDTTASGGKALLMSSNGITTGSVSFPSSVTSVTVNAKGSQCSGAPTMSVALDGTNILTNTAVSSTSWASYSATPANAINSGTHSLSINFNNYYAKQRGNSNNSCTRALYLDVTNFYGPVVVTPPPTVTLSASPTSVTAGAASTLTWASTNATSPCTASGAWSGTEPTSGSLSTGALNQNSTYTLTCTGAGGSASASTTVTITSTTPPPTGSKLIGFASGEGSYTLLDTTIQSRYLDSVKSAGAQIQRFAVRSTSQTAADSALSGILSRGITPLVDIMNQGMTPSNYGTLCDGIARKYGPQGVTRYETGNEPNLPAYWGSSASGDYVAAWQSRAQTYAAQSNACYNAIKAFQPTALVVTAGLSPYGQPVTTTNGVNAGGANPVLFLDWALAAGMKADAIGWHPYNFGTNYSAAQMLSTTDAWSAWAQMNWTTPNARSTMAKYGLNLPIWATEWGAPTNGGTYTAGVTEQTQADLMTQGIAAWESYSWAGSLMVYTAVDIPTQADNREGHFGLVRSDWTAKPALSAFTAAPK